MDKLQEMYIENLENNGLFTQEAKFAEELFEYIEQLGSLGRLTHKLMATTDDGEYLVLMSKIAEEWAGVKNVGNQLEMALGIDDIVEQEMYRQMKKQMKRNKEV